MSSLRRWIDCIRLDVKGGLCLRLANEQTKHKTFYSSQTRWVFMKLLLQRVRRVWTRRLWLISWRQQSIGDYHKTYKHTFLPIPVLIRLINSPRALADCGAASCALSPEPYQAGAHVCTSSTRIHFPHFLTDLRHTHTQAVIPTHASIMCSVSSCSPRSGGLGVWAAPGSCTSSCTSTQISPKDNSNTTISSTSQLPACLCRPPSSSSYGTLFAELQYCN